ncbi:immunoglobulin A1 protease autotransporter isoform X1 [Stomoxys calcitrans]|uniref:immunoglobulin A1 protease autotransporter isoform X1 n=1 Tax=Stomoxys calcitrans TaxID=35570 RepID=UPI0027E386F0|nr:immunoglobulin A1 protease autotransporter isoform X1 [Stomoxys calcitrans]
MSAAPLVANNGSSSNAASSTMGVPSRDMTGSSLFQYYMESFFKIPREIKNDIIYCQRALKAHIKVHQMVLEVFQQQPDADPQQKKRIIDELESEIYEINAEQNFLLMRLRRVIDEFYKMLKKNGIPTDVNATNAIVSKEIVPYISDGKLDITPFNVMFRNTEEKLIEKYFEVQKDGQEEKPVTPPPPPAPKTEPRCMEVINLDDDGNVIEQKISKPLSRQRAHKRDHPSASESGESLLKSVNMGYSGNLPQKSLLKPMNQRVANETVPQAEVKLKTNKNSILDDVYYNQRSKDEKEEKPVELPVSTNVRMSRLNLRQALKRAQAAVRGPTAATATITAFAPPPPPPPPVHTQTTVVASSNQKPAMPKGRPSKATLAAAAAAAAAVASSTRKSPDISSSSEEGTPERGPTPPHAYWPDELEETRTNADEYGQEMFLQIFDLFTPEVQAQMQQRRSKRRRRCVQNNNYHYGSQAGATGSNEPEPKKKRKAFLLSPQVKKALPSKRNKRRSADNASDINSVPPSRSASSSPQDDKRTCNECFKGGYNLEQCDQCKSNYHPQCHREEDEVNNATSRDPKEFLKERKLCPVCKKNNAKLIKKEVLINKNLQNTAQDLELKMAEEKTRREVLQKTGKMYKIQMNNLFKIVNSLKSENIGTSIQASSFTTSSKVSSSTTTGNDHVIELD